jgi:hypothetical protein
VLHHAPHPSLMCIMLAGAVGLAATTRSTSLREKRFRQSASRKAAFLSAFDKQAPATNKRSNNSLKASRSMLRKWLRDNTVADDGNNVDVLFDNTVAYDGNNGDDGD